jgi:hypothetical protein
MPGINNPSTEHDKPEDESLASVLWKPHTLRSLQLLKE